VWTNKKWERKDYAKKVTTVCVNQGKFISGASLQAQLSTRQTFTIKLGRRSSVGKAPSFPNWNDFQSLKKAIRSFLDIFNLLLKFVTCSCYRIEWVFRSGVNFLLCTKGLLRGRLGYIAVSAKRGQLSWNREGLQPGPRLKRHKIKKKGSYWGVV